MTEFTAEKKVGNHQALYVKKDAETPEPGQGRFEGKKAEQIIEDAEKHQRISMRRGKIEKNSKHIARKGRKAWGRCTPREQRKKKRLKGNEGGFFSLGLKSGMQMKISARTIREKRRRSG